jgi:hypothetical protein
MLIVGVQCPEEPDLVGVNADDLVEAMNTAANDFHDDDTKVPSDVSKQKGENQEPHEAASCIK